MARLVSPVLPPDHLSVRPQPTVAGDGLTLRPWRTDDLPAVVAAYVDPDLQRFTRSRVTDADAEAWLAETHAGWASDSSVAWAVEGDGTLLGWVGFPRLLLAGGQAEIGYWTTPAARGRGIARRAARIATAWAFQDGFRRVELVHSVLNPASCAVAEALGFPLEGVRRSAGQHPDGWHDMHVHSRLATD